MNNQASAPAPLVDTIAQYISELILSGGLEAGARINEAEMAERFGVSRGPVREAIAILSSGFIVDVYPRRGAFVADLSGDSVKQLCEFTAYQYACLTKELIRSTHSARQLEPFEPIVERLKATSKEANPSVKRFNELCVDWETQCVDMINNRFLASTLSQMGLAVRRVERLAFEDKALLKKHADFLLKLIQIVEMRDLNAELDTHFRQHYEEMWKQLVRRGKVK